MARVMSAALSVLRIHNSLQLTNHNEGRVFGRPPRGSHTRSIPKEYEE